MTLGERIRLARRQCGLSQEQFAQKLCVSRSAIAKWETDKGLPDVENLKELSRLLHISVDSLLDVGGQEDASVIREPVHLASYGRGCNKVKKNNRMLHRFPGATIYTLLGRPELSEDDKVLNSSLGFLTSDPFGTPEFIKSIRQIEKDFYLVEQDNEQLFVIVTDELLEIHSLTPVQQGFRFKLGNWNFIRCDQLIRD